MCSGVFEVSLLKLNNNRGLTHNGRCCVGASTFPPCTDQCQTFFSACLLHYTQSMPSQRSCTYGYSITAVFDANNILANEEKGDGIVIKMPVDISWPGQFTLIIEAWHDIDGNRTIFDSSQLIIQAFLSTTVLPNHSWHGEVTVTPTSELDLKYRLVCSRYYYGSGCDKLCRSRDDQFGHYTCDTNGTKLCKTGWNGPYCDQPQCSTECLNNLGKCERPFECRCRLGWHGKNCEECTPHKGCLHGYCHEPYQCICQNGWTGFLCDIDTQYCNKEAPCLNDGICINDREGNYTCLCSSGFGGKNCELPLCFDGYCMHGGVCLTRNGVRECQCAENLYGEQCEYTKQSCEDLRCENGGKCVIGQQGGKCKCPEMFTGSRCEQKIDACIAQLCRNGAECRESNQSAGEFTCLCPPGFGGPLCSIRIDACAAFVCYHNGKCHFKIGSTKPRCNCAQGFTGDRCEKHIDPCVGVTCLNSGACKRSSMGNGFLCHCTPEYFGEMCEMKAMPCRSSECRNGGSCRNYSSTFQCICPSNFSGRYCEVSKSQRYPVLSTQNNNNKTKDSNQLLETKLIENVQHESGTDVASKARLHALLIYMLLFPLITYQR